MSRLTVASATALFLVACTQEPAVPLETAPSANSAQVVMDLGPDVTI